MATEPPTHLAAESPSPEPRRYWQIPVFLLGLVAAYWAYQNVPNRLASAPQNGTDFADLRTALSQKSPDAATLEPLLQKLSASARTTPDHFEVGNGYVVLAEMAPSTKPDYWQAAQKAYENCNPSQLENPTDAGKLTYRTHLVKAAQNLGDPNETLKVLLTPPPGEDRPESARMLAQTALRTNPPNRMVAKEALAKYLSGPTRATSDVTAQCKLDLARLHINDKEYDKSRVWLSDLSNSTSPEVQALAKAHLGQLATIESNWTEAIKQYEAALLSPTLKTEERASIRYQTGLAWLNAGDDRAALPYLLQSAKEPGAIGGAAALKLATIRGRDPASRGVRSEAADWLEKAVAQVGTSNDLSVPELRASFEEVIKTSKSEGDFPAALRAATAYMKVAEPSVDCKHRAEICEQWATSLQSTSPADAKAKFVESANEYLKLSQTQLDTKNKAETTRKAAFLLRQAGENTKASELVSAIFTMKGVPEELVAQAWLDRAELLPGTQANEIEEALKKAIEIPSPAATTARCRLGLSYVKRAQELAATVSSSTNPDALKKNVESMNRTGRGLLTQVADAGTITAEEAATHEQAMFELGRLAMLDRQSPEAEARLRKQLALYPAGAYADNARLWLASVLLVKADGDPTSATKARQEALVYLKELAKSSDKFFQTWGELWEANTLLRSGDIDGTIKLSRELMVKHTGKLEELVAGKLLVHAYRASKPAAFDDAKKVLTRMEELFQSLPREAFRQDTEYSYDHWKAELPQLRELVK